MQWNTYREDFNSKKIVVYNIFNHGSFSKDLAMMIKKELSKQEFFGRLKGLLMYYFWSKCEHEVVITSWPPRVQVKEVERLARDMQDFRDTHGRDAYSLTMTPSIAEKIDIYDQVMLNWDVFANYVWDNRDKMNNAEEST